MIAWSMMAKALVLTGWASSFRVVDLNTSRGAPIRWDLAQLQQDLVAIRVYATYPNQEPSPERLRMAVVNGMRAWNWALGDRVPFAVWMGQEEGTFPPRFATDSMNSVFWRSAAMRQQDPVANEMSKRQAAYTQIYFDETTGQMQEFDMTLNDVDFRFVSRVDVAAGLVPAPNASNRELYLEDTVLHELGHALGLDHSLDPASVMYPTPSAVASGLGCDDQSSIRKHYPESLRPTGVGPQDLARIQGMVRSPQGAPLYGMGVMAIHQQNPELRASTVTRVDGSFQLEGLREGSYALFSYPMSHITRYFVRQGSWNDLRICSDPRFPQNAAELLPAQWWSDSRGQAQWVQAQAVVNPVELNLRCDLSKGKALATATPRFPVTLKEQKGPQGSVWSVSDRFRNPPESLPNETRFYRWTHAGGPLSVGWASDALGSLHSAKLALWKPTDNPREPQKLQEQASLPGKPGEVRWSIPQLEAGDYLLSVERSALRPSKQGPIAMALPNWSYFLWLDALPALPGCAKAPAALTQYEAPSPWPPRVHSGGCRVGASGQDSMPWGAGGLFVFVMSMLRRQRR